MTFTAILTLAVGIAAVTAMFSVVDAVLIRSVPFTRPGQLVVIWQSDPSEPSRIGEVSYYQYRLWRERSRQFSDLAAFGSVNWSLDLTGHGERRAVPFAAVSWTFFRTLGVGPLLGRVLAPDDDRPHAPPVVVVSYGFWKGDLGGDPGIVGRPLTLNGSARTVIGVMPAGFDFPHDASMWAPLVPELASVSVGQFQALEAPGLGVLYGLGRLHGAADASAAAAELVAIDRDEAVARGFDDAKIPRAVLRTVRDYVSEISGRWAHLSCVGGTSTSTTMVAVCRS